MFNGSTLRANNAGSDFCLVQLNQTPAANSGINYAGWSRNTVGIQQTTIIHHPAGDVMKITRDIDAPTQATFLGANCWHLTVDNGTTEGGSSGAPYFDQNHRIIAQHKGIDDGNLAICNQVSKFGGRFDLSWAGGGTAATRLSDWLDPFNSGAMTTNTINIANTVADFRNTTITGSLFICSSGPLAANNPAGTTVTWPTNLSGLSFAPNPSSNTTATRLNNYYGNVTVTATIDGGACTTSVQKTVAVGGYAPSDYTLNVNGSVNGYLPWCSNKTYVFAISNTTPGATSSNFNWTIPQGWSINYISNYLCVLRSPSTNYPPTGNISVSFNDNCGNIINKSMFLAYSCLSGMAVSTFPNPAASTLTVQVTDSLASTNDALPLYQLSLVDRNGMQIFSTQSDKSSVEISIGHLPQGIYYIRLIYGEAVLQRRVIIAR